MFREESVIFLFFKHTFCPTMPVFVVYLMTVSFLAGTSALVCSPVLAFSARKMGRKKRMTSLVGESNGEDEDCE